MPSSTLTAAVRRFPLLGRPQPDCPALPLRIQEIADAVETARQKADHAMEDAAHALNKAALIASDSGMTELARHLCWQHINTYRCVGLIQICEGKYWAERGGKGILLAAQAISDQFGFPFVGVNSVRGPGGEDLEIVVGVDHWEPLSGPTRELAARRWGRHGRKAKLPALLSADANSSPSGPHFAQRDWQYAAEHDWVNASHKGHKESGTWIADTEPPDYLIDRWCETHRVGGAGLTLLAEQAWQAHRDKPAHQAGGGLHIDVVLANDLMLRHFDPGSFRIHVPAPGVRRSDHRMLTWELHF